MSFIKTEMDETIFQTRARRKSGVVITEEEFVFGVGQQVWEQYTSELIEEYNSLPFLNYFSSGDVFYVSIAGIDRIFSKYDYKKAVVDALQAGKYVHYRGNQVFVEKGESDTDSDLRILFSNGCGAIASLKDIRAMEIG